MRDAVLRYVAERPLRPPTLMALTLRQPLADVELALDELAGGGLIVGMRDCCGTGWLYRATDAGERVAHENGA